MRGPASSPLSSKGTPLHRFETFPRPCRRGTGAVPGALLGGLLLCATPAFLAAQPVDSQRIETDLVRFETALASAPSDVGLRHDAGLACLWLRRLDQASRHFRAGLAVASGDAEVWMLLGKVERMRGGAGEAVKALRTAVALRPDEFENWFQLGLALSDLGLRGEAIEALERAGRTKPPPQAVPDLELQVGVLALANRDWSRAERQVAVLRKIDPERAVTLQRLFDLSGKPLP